MLPGKHFVFVKLFCLKLPTPPNTDYHLTPPSNNMNGDELSTEGHHPGFECPAGLIEQTSPDVAVQTNLLEKLRAEFEAMKDRDLLPHVWHCCKCIGGPYGIEEEAKIEDYDISQYCSTHDCYHRRCEQCLVSNISRSLPKTTLNRLSCGNRNEISDTQSILLLGPDGEITSMIIFEL